jgi:hypothetical protein
MSVIQLTKEGRGYYSSREPVYVLTEHITAVVPATKHTMDDPAKSEVMLVGGRSVRVTESPTEIAGFIDKRKES